MGGDIMDTATVRLATCGDYEEMARIVGEYPEDHPPDDDSRRYAGCQESQRIWWVAESEGVILGLAMVTVDRSRLWVNALLVRSAYRNLGIGSMLMAWVEDTAERLQLGHVVVPCLVRSESEAVLKKWHYEPNEAHMICSDGRAATLWLKWM